MKISRLNKLIATFEEELKTYDDHPHEHFNMGKWLGLLRTCEDPNIPPTVCDTVACIAGTAVVLFSPRGAFRYSTTYNEWLLKEVKYEKRAAELLGIDEILARNLFHVAYWPKKLLEKNNLSVRDHLPAVIWMLKEIRDGHLVVDHMGDWYYEDKYVA